MRSAHTVWCPPDITQVWADNLETEFAALRAAAEVYPFISMVRFVVLMIQTKLTEVRIPSFLGSSLVQ